MPSPWLQHPSPSLTGSSDDIPLKRRSHPGADQDLLREHSAGLGGAFRPSCHQGPCQGRASPNIFHLLDLWYTKKLLNQEKKNFIVVKKLGCSGFLDYCSCSDWCCASCLSSLVTWLCIILLASLTNKALYVYFIDLLLCILHSKELILMIC